MPEHEKSALLICDFQVGIGDQPYAAEAASRAAAALEAARSRDTPVIFSRVAFQPNYTDVSLRNQAFARYRVKNALPPSASQLISRFEPRPEDTVVTKNRFSAFAGNNLRSILRSGGVTHLVLAGVSTSGVILSTFTHAADEDFTLTILSDACADPEPALHEELVTHLFPRSAGVLTVDAWIKG